MSVALLVSLRLLAPGLEGAPETERPGLEVPAPEAVQPVVAPETPPSESTTEPSPTAEPSPEPLPAPPPEPPPPQPTEASSLAGTPFAPAEPRPPKEPEPPPRLSAGPAAFDRGPYFQAMLGTSSSVNGGIPLGLVVGVEGGTLLRGSSRLRGSVGFRITNTNAVQRDPIGVFGGQVRAGLGASTERVLALAHLGVGVGMLYFGRSGGGSRPVGIVALGGSLHGKVSPRVALGVQADAIGMLPWLPLQLQALADVTVLWGKGAKR